MITRNFTKKMMLGVDGQSVGFVDDLFALVVDRRASNVHIEPRADKTRIRIRVDGILQLLCDLPVSDHDAVVSRIKTVANMDIIEKKVPQSGHLEKSINAKLTDLYISTVPTVYGEKMAIKVVDKSNAFMPLNRLGFMEDNLLKYRQMFANSRGLVLVAGPVNSGKSTTLYSALNELNKEEINIVTIEEKVEYRLAGINQIELNKGVGLRYADSLRYVVDQDPDIIMVGEIKDEEVARLAVNAALSGHLVFASINTDDAISAVTRLLDMGIEPYLLASCLRGVVAQRLIRKVCDHCAEKYEARPAELACLHLPVTESHLLSDAQGCVDCFNTGYSGRVALQEVLVVNDEIRTLITEGASAEAIMESAKKNGFVTLYEDGISKVLNGITSLGELLRVVDADGKKL